MGPFLGITAATTISPHFLSFFAITAHSFTLLFFKSTSSISNAEILNPPLFIISIDSLPNNLKYPSSFIATSPVKNQSPLNDAFVLLGRFLEQRARFRTGRALQQLVQHPLYGLGMQEQYCLIRRFCPALMVHQVQEVRRLLE